MVLNEKPVYQAMRLTKSQNIIQFIHALQKNTQQNFDTHGVPVRVDRYHPASRWLLRSLYLASGTGSYCEC